MKKQPPVHIKIDEWAPYVELDSGAKFWIRIDRDPASENWHICALDLHNVDHVIRLSPPFPCPDTAIAAWQNGFDVVREPDALLIAEQLLADRLVLRC